MKFLCIDCDEQMKLLQTIPQEGGGGLSVLFGCPTCAYQICMMTNPWETQVVTSLGVRIGPGQEGADTESRCPFGAMLSSEEEVRSGFPDWTPEAQKRLLNIPEAVRPMAQKGVEHFARSKGYAQISEQVLDEARREFGM